MKREKFRVVIFNSQLLFYPSDPKLSTTINFIASLHTIKMKGMHRPNHFFKFSGLTNPFFSTVNNQSHRTISYSLSLITDLLPPLLQTQFQFPLHKSKLSVSFSLLTTKCVAENLKQRRRQHTEAESKEIAVELTEGERVSLGQPKKSLPQQDMVINYMFSNFHISFSFNHLIFSSSFSLFCWIDSFSKHWFIIIDLILNEFFISPFLPLYICHEFVNN